MTNGPRDRQLPFDDDSWEALARYVAGESPPEEVATVQEWLARSASLRALVTTLAAAPEALARESPDVEAALHRVMKRIREGEGLRGEAGSAERRRVGWRTMILRAAAVAAVLVGAGVVWRAAMQRSEPDLEALAPRTYTTAVGQTDSVMLPDGTAALLGPASQLTVEPDYGGSLRRLRLEGQALFTVQHDPAHPFVVRAGAVDIEDVGTTFSVRTDPDGVRVAVTVGMVVVRDTITGSPEELTLSAGDRGTLLGDGRMVEQRRSVSEDDLAWTQGRLVFIDAPLTQVEADLRRWYGIDVRADSTLSNRHLTASFAGESSSQVLNVIALALGATVERRGDSVVLLVGQGGLRAR